MIDLHDPEIYAAGDELAGFAALRARAPVIWHRLGDGGFWAVLDHAAATEVLARPERFSSALGTRAGVRRPPGALRTLNNLDGPAHARLRALIAPAFQRPDRLDAAVRAAISGPLPDELDLVSDLARPLSARVMCRWLGLGGDRAVALAERVSESHRAGAAALDAIAARSPDPIATRAARDAKDSVGRFVAAGLAEARDGAYARVGEALAVGDLSRDEAVVLGALLIEAGFPTVADAVASGLAALIAGRLAPRALSRAGADELLRLASPVVQFARTATAATELAGRSIAAGDQVVVYFAAANRDPRVFAAPDALDLDRRPNPHLSFGAGPHRCPGAAMARRVLQVTVDALGPRLAQMRPAASPLRRRSRYLRGFERFVVRLSPR